MAISNDWWNDPEQLHLFTQRMRAIDVPRRQFLKLIAAAGSAAALAACQGPSSKSGAANAGSGALAKDQTYRNGFYFREPLSFDFNKDLYCMGDPMAFAGLAYVDPNYDVQPDMAERWDVSDDGTTYTYHLRDSKWSNGDPVTAGDFEWSFKRQLNPATGASLATFLFDIKNAQAFNTKKISDESMVGVRALDAKTLQITLEGPRAYWPMLMAFWAALPANRKAVERYGDKWTDPGASGAPMPCNGPFKLVSWEHNKQFVLEKNEGHWNADAIKLTRVIQPILDETQLLIAYKNGEIDFYNFGNLGDLKSLRSDPRLSKQLFVYSTVGTWYLIPSATMPPFDNVKVRQAVAHAIDRETIVKDVLQGLGRPAYTMNPPNTLGYNPNTYDAEAKFDPKLAKEMLRGTPYEGGKNWPKITLTQAKENDAAAAAADAIVQMLGDSLGMKVEHEIGERRETYQRMFEGKIQLMWVRWYVDYPDPNDFEYLAFYGKTTSGHRQTWHDDQYDQLVTRAAGEKEPHTRATLYQQADEIIAKQAAAVFVYYPYNFGLVKPYVQGMPKNKAGELMPDWNIFNRMRLYLSIAEH